MNPSLPNPINNDLLLEDDESYLTARVATRIAATQSAQLPVALALGGLGVRQGVGDEFEVTAGTGLSVNIGTGVALVGDVGEGLACGVQLADPIVKSGLTASRDADNPLYLFVTFDEGDPTLTDEDDTNSITRPDSWESRQGLYQTGDSPTLTGAVLLATITTSGSAVLTVTMNPDRFINVGASGDAPTPAQAQQFRLTYSGSGPVTLSTSDGDSDITPGDSSASIKTELVAGIWPGITTADLDISGTNTAAGGAFPDTITLSGAGTSAVNASYAKGSNTNGAPSYLASTINIQFGGDGYYYIALVSAGSGFTSSYLYRAAGTTGAFPTTGWAVDGGTGTGSAPTVGAFADGTFALLITQSTSANLEIPTTATPRATITEVQPYAAAGVAASQDSLKQVHKEWQDAVANLKTARRVPITQTAHGFTKDTPIVLTSAGVFDSAGTAGLDIWGVVVSVEDADHFTFALPGETITVDFSPTPGVQYITNTGTVTSIVPSTSGDVYVAWGIALDDTRVVLVSHAPVTVP